jgi:hypothetical protein
MLSDGYTAGGRVRNGGKGQRGDGGFRLKRFWKDHLQDSIILKEAF